MTRITVPMHWTYQTKRCERYEADALSVSRDNNGEVPAFDGLYLQRSAIPGLTPRKINVTVEFE